MDHNWLKTQFKLHPDKSKADLAQALGLGAPAVSKILAGMRQIKATEYAAMRKFFGLPVDGERATAVAGAQRLSPLAGLKERAADEQSWIVPSNLLQGRTRAASDNVKVFAVQGNDMAPDFLAGEQVLVDLSDTKPSPAGAFIVADGLGYSIRHCAYVPQSKPPSVRLSASNPKFEAHTLPLDKSGLIGRVIAKLSWL